MIDACDWVNEPGKPVRIWEGDCLEWLRTLPEGSVNCCVTSPPYWGLRDYQADGQYGLEATPEEYVAKMVEVFREVRRVLRDDGVLWLNLGDSYASGGRGEGGNVEFLGKGTGLAQALGRKTAPDGLKPKDLCGIPWRVALALQQPWLICRGCGAENHASQWAVFPNGRRICPACEKSKGADVTEQGWWLRSDVIWSKPNPMPESVTDRPTRAHEYVFLLTKSARYWYDADAVREPFADERMGNPGTNGKRTYAANDRNDAGRPMAWTKGAELGGRNLRTVWTVATQPYKGAHFATFPEKLITPCILAGCPHKVCAECGAPWVREVEVKGGMIGRSWHDHEKDAVEGASQEVSGVPTATAMQRAMREKPYVRRTLGFVPTCSCDDETRPGIVIDPFAGAGTTGVVAVKHGREFCGCELSGEYVQMATARIERAREQLRLSLTD